VASVGRDLRSLRSAGPAWQYWYLQRARSRLFSRWIRRSFADFGQGSVIWPPISLWGAERISIGDRVRIGSNSRISTDPPGRLVIGSGTLMAGETMIHCIDSIEIGRDVGIARGVTIVDYKLNSKDPTKPVQFQGKRSGAVKIGDGTYIGAGAVIMRGVTIGRNAVIGANAVVNDDVADHDTVAGAPARSIRSRA
jgi:acetyltransferase-like isoleucine patch superfamily enzyme